MKLVRINGVGIKALGKVKMTKNTGLTPFK